MDTVDQKRTGPGDSQASGPRMTGPPKNKKGEPLVLFYARQESGSIQAASLRRRYRTGFRGPELGFFHYRRRS
jgi:hypothetical protein